MPTRKQPRHSKKQTLHERVTQKLVAQLKAGTPPWVKPWNCASATGMPRNYVSNRPYSGINVLLTWLSALERRFNDPRWLTANQVIELGGSFKGQSATRIVFAKQHTRNFGKSNEESFFVQKLYNVFNVEQVSGVNLEPEQEPLRFTARMPELEAFIAAQGVPVTHWGNRAFYSLARDAIVLPPPGSFGSPEAYYAVALHELVHASGHPERLARRMGKRDTNEYFVEELVAELGAAMVCAEFGLTCTHHAGYLASWIQLMESDAKIIFTAAKEASRAADYLKATAGKPLPVAV